MTKKIVPPLTFLHKTALDCRTGKIRDQIPACVVQENSIHHFKIHYHSRRAKPFRLVLRVSLPKPWFLLCKTKVYHRTSNGVEGSN